MRAVVAAACLFACAAHAVPIAGQGTWETTLQARDINSDGVVDAYYDSSTNLLWAADANLPGSLGEREIPRDPGQLRYDHAREYVANLNVFGVTGWRMPRASATYAASTCGWAELGTPFERFYGLGGSGPYRSCFFEPPSGVNELADLWRITLGNSVGTTGQNTGPFSNVKLGDRGNVFWMETKYVGPQLSPTFPWVYISYESTVGEYLTSEELPEWVWMVRDGDVVTAIPEPPTVAMFALGLGLLCARRRFSFTLMRCGVVEPTC